MVRINAAINIMMTRMSELRGTMSISRCANRTAVGGCRKNKRSHPLTHLCNHYEGNYKISQARGIFRQGSQGPQVQAVAYEHFPMAAGSKCP